VISSVLKEVRTAPYLTTLAISVQQAYDNWMLLYRHVLDNHSKQGQWLFVDYESLFTAEGLNSISTFTRVELDAGFVKPELNRSRAELDAPESAIKIYQELIERSRISSYSSFHRVEPSDNQPPACMASTKPGVVIWHVGRCGSSVLGHCLLQNPYLQWENEIFNRWMPQHIGTASIPPLGEAILEVRSRQQKHIQLIEVKYLQDQHPGIFDLTALQLASVLAEYGYTHAVILERRNILRRMVSHCLASETKCYHLASTDAPPSRQEIHIDVNRIQVGRSTRPLLEWLDLIAASQSQMKRYYAKISNSLHLSYEDHILDNPLKGYEAICNYLAIPPTPVQVRLQKTNPFRMSDIIINYAEIHRQVSSSQHAWMLEEES
jgi:hypothetical protein